MPASPGPPHAEELAGALAALEAVIALRLEERQAYAVHGTDPARAARALLARPLGLTGSEGLPEPAAYGRDGPLARVIRDCELGPAEALIVLAAVAPEIDEKFGVLYGLLTDRPGVDRLTGEVARNLCARTFAGRLAVRALLSPGGRLRGMRLIEVDPGPPDGPAGTGGGALGGRISPHPDLLALLAGGWREVYEPPAGFPATPLHTVHTMDDLVVPAEVRRRLAEVLDRVRYGPRVLDQWGFGRRHDGVRGTLVLFHGPPGTGKSMTAAVLARAAGSVAYRVDLAALVSKYIGETEKNLARVFDRAQAQDAVLVFDEADAIFGRRTEVSDARDRYANQEVSYLLQRVERHTGVVILTTNLLGNLDDAFTRRIDILVEFPAPGVAERLALWRRVLPPALPTAPDIDFTELAERYPLTGAEIRDAALAAAYLAAGNGQVVTAAWLRDGVRGTLARSGRAAGPAGR